MQTEVVDNLPSEATHESNGMMEVATTRAAQEVQAAMVIAKRFPRDQQASFSRIMTACRRRILAEASQYAFPRGGQTVTGPSIRLAEVLAQAWGNLACGTIELEQRDGESVMMSYAWDLETNTRCDKIFSVPHVRDTRNGRKKLEDARDVYEMTANMGARRLRACILAVIPGDVVEAAIAECDKTLKGNSTEPLIDRVRKMVSAFSELSVTVEMLERRVGHRLDATNDLELVQLRKIYQSIKDNMASREQFFPTPARGFKIADEEPQNGDQALSPDPTEPDPEPTQPDPTTAKHRSLVVQVANDKGITVEEAEAALLAFSQKMLGGLPADLSAAKYKALVKHVENGDIG